MPKHNKNGAEHAVLAAALIGAALFGTGSYQHLTSLRLSRDAVRSAALGRDVLHMASLSAVQPRKAWQPALVQMQATQLQLLGSAPDLARQTQDSWHAFAKAAQGTGHINPAVAARLHSAEQGMAGTLTQQAAARETQAEPLILAGGSVLLLSLLGAFGLARRLRLTQFRTIQTYLAAERTNWDKQRSAYDAQRDQLIAELQQAQQIKVELDHLRKHGSQQFEEFFRTLPVACFCFAASGKILRWNAACESLYGFTAADAAEQTLWETVVPDREREAMNAHVTRVLAGESLHDVERSDRNRNGGPLEVRCSMVPLRDAAGQIIGGLSANIAIADVKAYQKQVADLGQQLQQVQGAWEAQEAQTALATRVTLEAQQQEIAQLREAATATRPLPTSQESSVVAHIAADPMRDPLTGLPNHRAFLEQMHVEFGRAARYGGMLSLILVDLDDFGAYNATHGLEAGDEALKAVTALIQTKVRTVDVVTRDGGDEFAILLPETNVAGSVIAGRRFQSGIEGIQGLVAPLTAGVSVSTLTPDIAYPSAFLAKVVAALQSSRPSGPGRFVGADTETHEDVAAVLQSVRSPRRLKRPA